MDIMLLVVILAILLLMGAIVHYQWMVKKHQKTLYGKGGEEHEVISLDEEDHSGEQEFEPPPSKSFIVGSMGLLIMVFFYYFFFYQPPAADGSLTYDEHAMQSLCQKLVDSDNFMRETPALLVLPPPLLNEYLSVEEGETHPFIDDLLIDSILTRGQRFTIVGKESSAPFYRPTDPNDTDFALTPSTLRDLLRRYEGVKVVICLAGYRVGGSEQSVGAQDRSFYLAVFSDQPLLYPYLDMAKERAFDLALISKGAYNSNQAAPDDLTPEAIIETHFLYISPDNERYVRNEYRQYIGVFPPGKNAYFTQ